MVAVHDGDGHMQLALCKSCARPGGLAVPEGDLPATIAMVLGLRNQANAEALARRLSSVLPDLPWDAIRRQAELHRATFRSLQQRPQRIQTAGSGTPALTTLAIEAAKDEARFEELYLAVARLLDGGNDRALSRAHDELAAKDLQDAADELEDAIDEAATTPVDIITDARTGEPYTIYGIAFLVGIFIPEPAETKAIAATGTVIFDATATAHAFRGPLFFGPGPSIIVDSRLYTVASACGVTPSRARRWLRSLGAAYAVRPDGMRITESPFPKTPSAEERANLFVRVGIGAIIATGADCDAIDKALFGPVTSDDDSDWDAWQETLNRWADVVSDRITSGLADIAPSALVFAHPHMESLLTAGDAAVEFHAQIQFRAAFSMYESEHPGHHPDFIALAKNLGDIIEFSITDPAERTPLFQHVFNPDRFADPDEDISDLIIDGCQRLGITRLYYTDKHSHQEPVILGPRRRLHRHPAR
jgi:hypothetical protein